VAARIGRDLVPLRGREVTRSLESRPECDHLVVRNGRVIDVEVEVDLLLLRTLWPHRGHVVESELDPQAPLPVDVHHAVPVVVVGNDLPFEHRPPAGALRAQIGCIEHK
jgi:hypothetical protein